jgi:excisionase family DNA binding protein
VNDKVTDQSTPINPTCLLRAGDVARLLSVSRAEAYRLLQSGAIPTVRLGRLVRVDPADLQQFIASCKSYRCDFLFHAKLEDEDRTLTT